MKAGTRIEILDPDQGRQKSPCTLVRHDVECYAECRISYLGRNADEW